MLLFIIVINVINDYYYVNENKNKNKDKADDLKKRYCFRTILLFDRKRKTFISKSVSNIMYYLHIIYDKYIGGTYLLNII